MHKKFKNKNLYESLSAYGIGFHRHNSEIHQELKNNTSSKINFTFTHHIITMFRGILSTIYLYLKQGTTLNKVQNILKIFHKKNKFVKIKSINSFLSTNDVMNTNYCFISVCKTKFKDKIIHIILEKDSENLIMKENLTAQEKRMNSINRIKNQRF